MGASEPVPPETGTGHGGARRTLTTGLVAIVLLAAALGVVVGHAVWSSSSPTTSPSTSLPTSTTPTVPPSTLPQGRQGSSAGGAPSNAASLAADTDPALVDIDVTDTYQALQGAGTGMVLSSNGEVLTNNHVIEGATSISVTDVGNGNTYSASVVGYDRSQDVAVLQLTDASGLQATKLGDSSTVAVGDGVVAVGNAGGTGGTPSYASGSVTATDQSITAADDVTGTSEELTGLIETNADIVPGDSGGALVDSAGQVIGMVTAGSVGFEFQPSATEGYAIPIDTADTVAKQIESGQSSSTVHIGPTALLGVDVETPVLGISGAEIVEVVVGGPAAQAGLTEGDIITAVDGQPVTSPDSLTSVMLGEAPGTTVPVQYLDPSGLQHTVSVQLASGPAQ